MKTVLFSFGNYAGDNAGVLQQSNVESSDYVANSLGGLFTIENVMTMLTLFIVIAIAFMFYKYMLATRGRASSDAKKHEEWYDMNNNIIFYLISLFVIIIIIFGAMVSLL